MSRGIKEIATGLQHIGIPVNDMEKTVSFYQKLGFESSLETVNEAADEKVVFMSLGINSADDEIHFLPFWEHGVRFFTIEGPNKEKIEFSQYL